VVLVRSSDFRAGQLTMNGTILTGMAQERAGDGDRLSRRVGQLASVAICSSDMLESCHAHARATIPFIHARRDFDRPSRSHPRIRILG
jgi:hypothetical protein